MHVERQGDQVVAVLDAGDLVGPVDRDGFLVGEVRPLVAAGGVVSAQWRISELAVQPDDERAGPDVTLGFTAYMGDDPRDPGAVAFTSWCPHPLRFGTDDLFVVIDQAR